MKKIFLPAMILLLTASLAFGANFTPPVMKLSTPSKINYQFDGSNLVLPVSVSGSPGAGMFLVYTNGKASSIGPIKNGHLGWHYVNKVDTCLFVSSTVDLKVGSNSFTWNGKTTGGAALAKGDYTYYIFAYDNKSPKLLASQVYTLGYSYPVTIETKDAKGTVLSNPIMYLGGNSKWKVGSDPMDVSLKETTAYRGGFSRGTHIALDPADHAMVYTHESEGVNQYIVKYKWVPNGVAEIQTAWADKGIATLGACPDKYVVPTGAYTDGETIWASSAFPMTKTGSADLYFADLSDGSLSKRLDVSDWYLSLDDMNKGGQFNGGPDGIYFRNNILFTQGLEGCMVAAIDPYREADADKVIWTNGNGDYVHDHNFETTAKVPWMCNDFMTGPDTYSISADAN
ncbi:MAG: hypothetical protein ACYC9O_06060, partial [Candidatus Latescibacterota bacterium]